jgi:hypothetical protein
MARRKATIVRPPRVRGGIVEIAAYIAHFVSVRVLGKRTPEGEALMWSEIVRELLNDRHAIDAIARAIVSGERRLGNAADTIADDVASLMINRLAAARVSGHDRVAHLQWNAPGRRQRVERRYGRELLSVLIQRTDKHLAHAAMMAFTRGD